MRAQTNVWHAPDAAPCKRDCPPADQAGRANNQGTTKHYRNDYTTPRRPRKPWMTLDEAIRQVLAREVMA